jgi:cell wall-associated NlpC family hydrolase
MRLLARVTLSMVVGAGLVAAAAAPGYAQPGQVPDPGARPAPAGQLPLPDGSFARPPTAAESLAGPLSAEIAALDIRIGTLTAERQTVEPAITPAAAEAGRTEQEWHSAGEALADAQLALDELVGESYRGAAALPPELFIPELRGLSAHAPVPVEAPLGVAAAARKLLQARATEQQAADLYQTAQLTAQDLTRRQTEIDAQLAVLTARRERLVERNVELLAAAERAREAAAQEQDFPIQQPVAGFRAGPEAVRAVEYALRQLGKPYEWGAEGPDRFDCSGLMWAAYRSVGRTLPRVAADQYWGTRLRLVAQTASLAQQGLLPGDLVFFASGPSWQSVHHVGMYVGNGYMVHAPNRNDVVKVSPVWWSRFFAATRVVDAVPVEGGPDPVPTREPELSPDPLPTGRPADPQPQPGPTGPGPDDPSPPDPDPTPPAPSPSGSPSPEPEESPTPSPEDSPSPEPEESPTPSPEDSPSPTPEAGSPSPSSSSLVTATPTATAS